MRTTCALGIASAIIVGMPVRLTAQGPAAPPTVHGCLRPDVEKSKEAIRKAIEQGAAAEEAKQVMKEVPGCTAYTITFQSALNIVSHGAPGGTSKISGVGAITFGLTGDPSEPEFELTSGPTELTAPVFWSGAEITLANKCIVRTVALPMTEFSFWLGVKTGAEPTAAVQITPAGDELHPTFTKCPKPTGGYTNEQPGKAQIFTPAWSSLHALGNTAASAPDADMTAMNPAKMQELAAQKQGQGMDMEKLMAMADKLKGKQPSPAEMMQLVKEVAPDADQQVEAARNNFKLKMPGDCAPAAGFVARCTINRTITVPDGKGGTQTITESTVVVVTKAAGA